MNPAVDIWVLTYESVFGSSLTEMVNEFSSINIWAKNTAEGGFMSSKTPTLRPLDGRVLMFSNCLFWLILFRLVTDRGYNR